MILTHIYKKIQIYIWSNLTKNSFELSIHLYNNDFLKKLNFKKWFVNKPILNQHWIFLGDFIPFIIIEKINIKSP